ncbi:hypothetical protein KJ640_02800, partial [bacterium]|nr:hypothetical protein [bacterium]
YCKSEKLIFIKFEMINAKFAICNEVFDNYLLLLNLEKSQINKPVPFSTNKINGRCPYLFTGLWQKSKWLIKGSYGSSV